jgi:aminoglycoside phosphotransferase (APT) family kinase protein
VAEALSEAEVAERLLAHLQTELGRPALTYAEPPARVTGGNETYIYGFRLDGAPDNLAGSLILRAYRQGYMRPDQARFEAAVQNAVAGLGYPAARVFVTCQEPAVLGTPFIVMERLSGSMVLEGIGGPDASGTMRFSGAGRLLRSVRLLWEIPRALAEAQVRLHDLDPQPLLDAIEREGLPRDSITVEGRLETLRAYIDANRIEGFREVVAWLVEHAPLPEKVVICHCDIQPNNLLMTGGVITGVVDWSQVIVAGPALDVGCTKMAMDTAPLEMPPMLQWLSRPISRTVSRGYVGRYTKERPLPRSSLDYYGALRAISELARVAAMHVGSLSEPGVWDNPAGVRNLIQYVRSIAGIEVRLPDDTRAPAE